MKRTRRYLAIAALFVGALLIMAGQVHATPYAFSVDRFALDGNLPGHFVDEFDSPTLNSAWFVHHPTVTQSRGVLTLSSPGNQNTFTVGNLAAAQQESDINSSPGHISVRDGSGDYIATSRWLPGLPKISHQFHMEVRHGIGPGVNESIAIAVANLDPAVATALGFPAVPPGDLRIIFGREDFDIGTFSFQAFAFDPSKVTGDILLQLHFSDASNQFTGAFSLDGGNSFQKPFTPVSPSAGDATYEWGLHGLSLQVVPEPSAVLLWAFGLAALAYFGRKGLGKKSTESGSIGPPAIGRS